MRPGLFRPAAALLAVLASPLVAVAADWEQTSLPAGYQYRLAVNAAGHVFATGGPTTHVSTDDGATWSPAGPFVANRQAQALTCAPSGALYAGDIAMGVYRSDDGGATWSGNLVTEGCNALAVHPIGVVMAGLTYTGNGKVHRSEDAGANWTGIALPEASHSFATECFAFGDSGETYAGTIDGFYRSTDLGQTWERRNAGLTALHVRTLTVTPNGHLFLETLYPAAFDGMYRSTDRGRTWTRCAGNALYFSALVAGASGELVGAADGQVRRSTDEGVTWSSFATGIPTNERLVSLVRTPTGRLLAGGYRVFRTTSSLLDAGEPPVSRAAVLDAPAPNPAVGATRLAFTLPRASRVDLAVFDLAGRRVATLANGPLGAGPHAVTLDASGLRAGAYVCRLDADGVVRTRRLLVTR